MKRREILLWALLFAIMIISAILYILGRAGLISKPLVMLLLLPLMIGVLILSCILYAEATTDETRDR